MAWLARRGKAVLDTQTAVPRLLSYQLANMQGIGSRSRQEDSFAFVNALDVTEMKKKGLLALLADGMGGMEDGKAVSEEAVSSMVSEFGKMDREKNIGDQLYDGVIRTNCLLYSRFLGMGGTTLVACVFFREKLYFASVGDSFLYLKRKKGLYRINQAHTCLEDFYWETVETGNMDPISGRENPEAASLTEFLGKEFLEKVDMFCAPWRVEEGDQYLLCSDGVGGVLTEDEIARCMETEEPTEALDQMEREILKKGRKYQDNYTALLIKCRY